MKKVLMLLMVAMLALPGISMAKMKAPDVLDTEKIKTDESLSKYKKVGVRLFSLEDVNYENVDEEEMKKMKRFQKECQEKLARSIKNDLEDNDINAIILDEDSKGSADMIIDGKITQINLGSAVGRMIWGMGAGQAGLSVEGRLIDAKTGEDLATFEHENSSGLGNGEKWTLVLHETQDLGEKISEFVRKLSK
jgi:hypothetical protein